MAKIPCSAGLLTFNSAETLARALESLRDFEELIVCDGGSSDDTLEIARSFGARIIEQDPQFKNPDNTLKDYAGVRNQCLDTARYDWFFYIDSDEIATQELVAEIRAVVESPDPALLVYNISPRIVLDGRLIKHSSNYPGWQKRFFNKRSGARFRKPIHERIGYDENSITAGYLHSHWHYFINRDGGVNKTMKYARLDAVLNQTGDTANLLRLIWLRIVIVCKVVLKSAFNYVRYGYSDSMPLSLEYSRVRYQLLSIGFLWSAYRGRKI